MKPAVRRIHRSINKALATDPTFDRLLRGIVTTRYKAPTQKRSNLQQISHAQDTRLESSPTICMNSYWHRVCDKLGENERAI